MIESNFTRIMIVDVNQITGYFEAKNMWFYENVSRLKHVFIF